MNVHYLQHIEAETPGSIIDWAGSKHHLVKGTKLYKPFRFPSVDDFDWLFVMGGPMGVYEEKRFPWLKEEKLFIEETIKAGKTVIGICLGSQLIAEVLGSKVYQGLLKEIGWYSVHLTDEAQKSPFFNQFEQTETVFHWHGDTYDLPTGTTHLAGNQVYDSQAFSYDDRVFGFQFHLEFTPKIIKSLIEIDPPEFTHGPYVQTEKDILSHPELTVRNKQLLISFLDSVESANELS